MAENNSSAPLKTAEGAYPAPLIDGAWYWVRYFGLFKETEAPAQYKEACCAFYSVSFSGVPVAEVEILAPLAVAAQAAPAAVAVPDDLIELAMLNKLIDLGSEAAYESAKSSSDDGPKGTAAFVRWQDLRANMRALIHTTYPGLATPALPATEYSSAGDLAEVQTEPVASIYITADGQREFDDWRVPLPVGRNELYTAPQAQPAFQQRVQPWMMECFGAEHAADRKKRNQHFLEEALELVQSTGWTLSEAHQLVDYVYGRPAGEPAQEVGGVMVTLAALCLANHLNMHACGETELARIWSNVDNIRARQAAKPSFSPLPQAQPADALDAKRWRAAAHDLSLKNLALVSVDDYGACEMLTGDEANEAIDAAMAAAQEGGNAAKEA